MKKILIILALAPMFCSAQTMSIFAESQNIISKTAYTPILKVQGDYVPKKLVGFMMFFTLNPKWGEGIASISISPEFKKLDAFTFTAGVGIEHANNPARMMTTLFIKKKIFTTFSVFELGGSGWWYSHKSMVAVYKNDFKVGVFAERFTGFGPRVEFSEKPFTFFVGPVYDFESKIWKVNFGIDVFWSR